MPGSQAHAGGTARRCRLLVFSLVPLLLGADRPPGLVDVPELRTWSYADYPRVVLEFSGKVELEADPTVTLPADPAAGMPERLYGDLPGVGVGRR